jgi:putative ABC transport system permease protein
MKLFQTLIEAMDSLRVNKLRSSLTILGIVIGVAAVIAMLSIGNGVQASITGSINSMGSNLLYISSGNESVDLTYIKPLTTSDADSLLDQFQAPSVKDVAPIVNGNVVVSYGGNTKKSSLTGATESYAIVTNKKMAEGEFITKDQNLGRESVAVIGTDVAKELFGRTDGIVGETIRIDGQPFKVIGVLTSSGGSMMGSSDNIVIIPLSTAQIRLVESENNSVSMIYVTAIDSKSVKNAIEEVSQVLRQRHHTKIGKDDFSIFSQAAFITTASSITGVFTLFLGGIAGISLLVGGIGIMNIMLVSVTERTREIGLRKALGARKKDILIQFLTESLFLSLLGGIIGIILGFIISFVVGRIASSAGTPINPTITLSTILMATAFSTAIGLFFGIYPANRAGGLEPVEALRYE